MNRRKFSIALVMSLAAAFLGLSALSARAGDSTSILNGKVAHERGVWVLKLPAKITIYEDGDSATSSTVQFSGYSESSSILLNNLNGKKIQISGKLRLASSARHVFPIVFSVSDSSIRRLAEVARWD